MDQLEEKAKRRRSEKEEEKEVTRSPDWSELHPDLLQCILKRLSFTSLNRSKLVCSWWYGASKGCVPSQNQIPWLILFPSNRRKKKNNRCMFFIPEDKEKVYRSRDLGVEFARSYCVTTCESWLLLMNRIKNFYILNPLTGERIDLPNIQSLGTSYNIACFWIDNKTKDYLVVMTGSKRFTKNGFNSWEKLDCRRLCQDVFYNDKSKKLYLHVIDFNKIGRVDIWDFSGDMPILDGYVSLPWFHYDRGHIILGDRFYNSNMVFTMSGDFLMIRLKHGFYETWYFSIFKRNKVDDRWEQTDSLGDEALIYGLSTTIIANGNIPGIKRNSIYFSNRYICGPKDIFVYDLTTHQVEPLPQRVLSSIPSLTKTRWFFPC